MIALTFDGSIGNIFLTLLIFLLIVLIPIHKHIFSYWKRRGIKGPSAIPFFGSVFSFSKPQALYLTDNYREYGKIHGMYQGIKPMLCVADPIIIKRILVQDFNVFRNRPGGFNQDKIFEKNLFSSRDNVWKRIRSILSPMFTTSKLKKMESAIYDCIYLFQKSIDKFVDRNQSILIRDSTGNFTMDVIAKCAFATDTNAHCETKNPFVRNAIKIFEFNLLRVAAQFITPKFLFDFLYEIKMPYFYSEAITFFKNLGFHLVKQRKECKDKQFDDMLQLMVNAKQGEDLRYEEEDEFDSFQVNLGKFSLKLFRTFKCTKLHQSLCIRFY
ncbi:ATPase [Sarcoptes scabiei]|nr:ATPase [Sarcoptes scabiei]